ncbi:MAG: TolC family protein, partial [Phycisphaerae bacterium]
MRLAACAVLIFGVAAPLTGCVGGHRSVDDASSAIDAWTRPQLSTAVSPANPASDSTLAEQAGVSTPVQPAPRETDESRGALRTLVEYALEHNASVRAAVADVRARLARIAQATALPDPVVRAIVRPEPIQTAAGDAYFTLGVSQKLPPPAKLDHSGKMAWAEANAAIERLNALRLELVADIEVAYYQLYLIDRSIELTEAYLSTLEDIENVLAAQYRVGKAEQQDVLRAQSELAKLRDDHGRLRRERSSTAAAL